MVSLGNENLFLIFQKMIADYLYGGTDCFTPTQSPTEYSVRYFTTADTRDNVSPLKCEKLPPFLNYTFS